MFALFTNDSVVNLHTGTHVPDVHQHGSLPISRGERGSGAGSIIAHQVRGSGYLDDRRCSIFPCVLIERRREAVRCTRTTRLGNRQMSNGVRRTDMEVSTVSLDVNALKSLNSLFSFTFAPLGDPEKKKKRKKREKAAKRKSGKRGQLPFDMLSRERTNCNLVGRKVTC